MSGFVIFLFKYLFVVPHYATILKPKLNEKTFNFIENLCMHLKSILPDRGGDFL